MLPETSLRNISLLKTRREELLAQIAVREKERLKFDDLKAALLETQVAILAIEPGTSLHRQHIE